MVGYPARWNEPQARKRFGLSISIARQLSRDFCRAINLLSIHTYAGTLYAAEGPRLVLNTGL
jgi:hypothetical protein